MTKFSLLVKRITLFTSSGFLKLYSAIQSHKAERMALIFISLIREEIPLIGDGFMQSHHPHANTRFVEVWCHLTRHHHHRHHHLE